MTRKRIFQIGLMVILVLVFIFAAGVLILRSHAFHRYLIATLVERAQQAIGGRVEVGDIRLGLSGLRVDVYRVAIHGTEPDPRAPLLWVDHIGVALKVVSLWRRDVSLREIIIDRPVVNLSVDGRGRSNLPQTPPPAPGSKPGNVFDLAIGHIVVSRGEIYYNDRQVPLDAEARDFQMEVLFNSSQREYKGTLGYRQGRVQFGNYNPLQHDLEAEFSAAPRGLILNSLQVKSGASRVTARARLENYSNPSLDGSYDLVLSTGEFKDILKNNSLPSGEVNSEGVVQYRGSPGQPLLDGLSVQGRFSSPALAVEAPQARANFRALTGEYHLNRGALEVRNIKADLLGGRIAAEFTMRRLATEPEARVIAALRGISFADTTAALRNKPHITPQISGRLDGEAEASWRGRMEDLQVRLDSKIAASTPATAGTGASGIPLNGVIHLTYNGNSEVISFRQTRLRTAHAGLDLDGSVGDKSALGIRAQCDDLHEIDALLLAIRTATSRQATPGSQPPELFGLGGTAAFNGQILGPLKKFRLIGHLTGTNLRYRNANVPTLGTDVALSSSSVALHKGELQTGPQGRVQFDVAVELKDWSYTPQSPIKLKLVASKVPLADLQRIANMHYPVSGILSVNITAQGTQLNPNGKGLVQLSQGRAWDQPIQGLSIGFQTVGNAIQATVNLHTDAGSANAKLTYSPSDQRYDAQVDVPGLRLEQLELVRARNPELAGELTLTARGRGTLRAPRLEATIYAPRLQIHDQKLDGLKIQADVADQQAKFSLDSSVVGASIQAHGDVNLNSDYEATASVDARDVQLGPLLAAYRSGGGRDLHGKTVLHGWIKGPLKRPELLEAHLEIPAFNVSYQSVQVANATPIQIDYRHGTLTLNRVKLTGTGTDLQLEATVPLGTGGALEAKAAGEIDLQILQVLNPQLESSGRIKLDVTASGLRAHPEIRGTVRVVNAAFQMVGAPLGAEKVNGEFEIQSDRVHIKEFRAATSGGTVTARGFALYRPAIQFNVSVSAKEVRLRYPEGIRAVLDSDLSLNGTPDAASLTGRVLINGVSFTNAFDLATFADQFSGPSSPPNGGFAQKIKLDVAVASTQEMGLGSSKVSFRGLADLRVRGTAAEPVILGRANITGGEFFFNDRRYHVQTGVIQFVNPVRTEPVVNLVVTTVVDQFNINLNFVGPLDHLRTTYMSEPPLPPVDVINLLVTGHTAQAASASPTTPQSVLAGQLAGQVGSRVGKMAGISSLKIDPQIGGSGGNAGARLAIQQRVTKNLFFTFATDVTSTQGQVVQAEYQVTRKYSLSAVRNSNGGYSVQVKMRKRF